MHPASASVCGRTVSLWHLALGGLSKTEEPSRPNDRDGPQVTTPTMSRASKITLALTTLVTTVTVIWVHKVQADEQNALHQGPIKDAHRMQEKALKKKLIANQQEHDYQQELRKKYEQIQPLSGETMTGPEEPEK